MQLEPRSLGRPPGAGGTSARLTQAAWDLWVGRGGKPDPELKGGGFKTGTAFLWVAGGGIGLSPATKNHATPSQYLSPTLLTFLPEVRLGKLELGVTFLSTSFLF